jgi:hypothetical protein
MGFMDSLKKATGIGLNATEHYDRAWEKGVLLGPEKYADASALFDAAHRKATEAQDPVTAARARANAALYSWVATGKASSLQQLRASLEDVQDLEVVGSRTEAMPSLALQAELDGRLTELQLQDLPPNAYDRRIQLHQRASEVFKRIFSAQLFTYRFHAADQHTQTAQARFFLHQGMLAWNGALSRMESDPEGASEHAARALASFRQCNDQQWSQTAETWLTKMRTRRTCWMCHRELQGLDVHVRTFPALVTPYLVAAVTKLGQDLSSLDAEGGNIVLCAPCGSSVEKQADLFATRRAGELRAEVMPHLAAMAQDMEVLRSAIRHLQSVAHSH